MLETQDGFGAEKRLAQYILDSDSVWTDYYKLTGYDNLQK